MNTNSTVDGRAVIADLELTPAPSGKDVAGFVESDFYIGTDPVTYTGPVKGLEGEFTGRLWPLSYNPDGKEPIGPQRCTVVGLLD